MKKLLIYLGLVLLGYAGMAQKLVGDWEGLLRTETSNLPILLHFIRAKVAGGVLVQFQSPRQSKARITFNKVEIGLDSFQLESTPVGIRLEGTIQDSNSVLVGFWKQGGKSYPVRFNRYTGESALAQIRRPQTPVPPFPYRSDSVTIPAIYSSLQFGGTLTRPTSADAKRPVAAVLLIAGSGPSDRDETMFEHKPFAVLANALTLAGYAVLRVDDRGVGTSTGKFYPATTHDFSLDAEAAFQWLRQQPGIDSTRCGLIGHSEGGLIAAMLAARVPSVAFVVSMAGPGVDIIKLMGKQNQDLLISRGVPEEAAGSYRIWYMKSLKRILSAPDSSRARQWLTDDFQVWRDRWPDSIVFSITGVQANQSPRNFLSSLLSVYNNVWLRYFMETKPSQFWKQVKVPVLAINGMRDIQVSALSNLTGIQRSLWQSGNRNLERVAMEGLNHMFQRCQRCTVEEYGELEQTLDEQVPATIIAWLNKHTWRAQKR